jgi:hypothetical protein
MKSSAAIFVVAACSALFVSSVVAQPSAPGKGPGAQAADPASQAQPPYGPGRGPGPGAQGRGPGNGGPQGSPRGGPRMPRFGSSNTPGWSMMTPAERDTYRSKMRSAKSVEECQSALTERRSAMEARAKERGIAAPRGPRADMCQVMQQRGFFK